MTEPKLVLPYQPSSEYSPEYIHRIATASDVPVEVIQEERWPGWWCKMGLFDPKLRGDFLVCDLDTIILGSLRELASYGHTMMLRDFFFPSRAASGVMFLTEEDRARVWEQWIKSPASFMRKYKGISGGGDGALISQILRPTRFVQDVFPGYVCSFKVDCRGGPPKGARMLCYHGNPRPHATGWATDSVGWWDRTPPKTSLRCGEAFQP